MAHEEQNQTRESNREHERYDETHGVDDSTEHGLINLGGLNHERLEEDAQEQAEQATEHHRDEDFAEDVCVRLAPGEAKHLERRDFTNALLDVDVGEVVQNDVRKKRSCNNQNDHDQVDALEHGAVRFDDLIVVRKRLNAVDRRHLLIKNGAFVLILANAGVPRRVIRVASERLTISTLAHEQIIMKIILGNAGNRKRMTLVLGIAHGVLSSDA